jgi:hypothetical protein
MRIRAFVLAVTLIVTGGSAPEARAQGMVFPLSGPWGALQGPPCPAPGNHHCGTANQQFAYDFVPLDVYGNPNPNACIGQPILSPTDGIVVEALDAYPNALSPGQHIAGNHIVIQRSPSEYILIAHLSPGTLTVGTGATVAAGQVIGACGYNGNTSAPHVHIHMQAGPVIMNFATLGLPMHFGNGGVRFPGGPCIPLAGNLMLKGMMTC